MRYMLRRARSGRALALAFGLALTPASSLADDGVLEGIWKGMLVARAAEVEAEILVEIGRTPGGELAGTYDQPIQSYKFLPLGRIVLDGTKVILDFRRNSESRGKNALTILEGEMSEDRRRIEGEMIDGDLRYPFYLDWAAEAGTPREEPRVPEVALLSDRGEELREEFNREKDHVRLILTLSPT